MVNGVADGVRNECDMYSYPVPNCRASLVGAKLVWANRANLVWAKLVWAYGQNFSPGGGFY